MIFHSPFEYYYLWLPLIGFAVGLWGSMLGGGGGFFFIPALILLFNVPSQIAVATSLAASIPICIIGYLGHYRNKNIDLHMGLLFSTAGVVGAFTGAKLTSIMTSDQLKTSFGIYSIIIAIIMIAGRWREKRAELNNKLIPEVSIMQKLTSGSFAMRIPVKIVLGTSLVVSTVNTLFGLGGHFLVGEIDLTLVYFLTSGAVVGALLGPQILAGIKIGRAEGPVRIWYAIGMIIFGIIMILSN
jgi:uncharacterized membrane protein YfcA